MNNITFTCPSFPTFLLCGRRVMQKGQQHVSRKSIKIYDVLFVTQGVLFIEENGIRYQIEKGQYLILEPEGAHLSYQPCEEETSCCWVHFLHHRQENIHEIQAQPWHYGRFTMLSLCKYGVFDTDFVLELWHKLQPMQTLNTTSHYIQSQDLFCKLLFHLCSLNTLPENAYKKVIVEVDNVIRHHIENKIDVNMIGEALNYNPIYINRCIKKYFGLTLTQYINKIKIEHAKDLMLTSDFSISQISAQCGFCSQSYFTKTFREHMGITPLQFKYQEGLV